MTKSTIGDRPLLQCLQIAILARKLWNQNSQKLNLRWINFYVILNVYSSKVKLYNKKSKYF